VKILSLIQHYLTVFSRFYNCSFNRELYEGRLPKRIFRAYLEQDRLYLADYAGALNLVSARLPNKSHAQLFRSFAKNTIGLEQAIHTKYLKKLSPDSFFRASGGAVEKIPVIAEYTAQLLFNAEHAPVEEAVASLIPCFWIYKDLGIHMDLSVCDPKHPYREWIATYADEEFRDATNNMITVADELNVEINCLDKRSSIAKHFWQSVEFEYRFFEEIVKPLSLDVNNYVAPSQRM